MTPDDAREILDFGDSFKRRAHRYVLEGGVRCVWECRLCGSCTEAETANEACDKLAMFHASRPDLPRCSHSVLENHEDLPRPPHDFT